MELKTYRIVKNMLLPLKTNIIIDDAFFQVGKKKIEWQNIKACSCYIQSVNRGMNYIIALDGVNKESVYLNIVHNIAASKSKKETFAEIYNLALEQIEIHHILPKANEYIKELERGNEVTIEKVRVSISQVEINVGLIKKEKVTLPMEDIELQFIDGSGGFGIGSKTNKKQFQHIIMAGSESRYLLQVMRHLLGTN